MPVAMAKYMYCFSGVCPRCVSVCLYAKKTEESESIIIAIRISDTVKLANHTVQISMTLDLAFDQLKAIFVFLDK